MRMTLSTWNKAGQPGEWVSPDYTVRRSKSGKMLEVVVHKTQHTHWYYSLAEFTKEIGRQARYLFGNCLAVLNPPAKEKPVALDKVKPNHNGAKNGGGAWGRRAVVKPAAAKRRRAEDKQRVQEQQEEKAG